MTFIQFYIIFLIFAAISGGVVNLYQLMHFIKHSKSRFLSSRNPPLIIFYCIVSLLTTFMTTPIKLYLHGFATASDNFFAEFATEFFMEFGTTVLLIIIVCRSWLLYYDYKFSVTTSDEIWRNLVNNDEENFWKKHRKTYGNLHFIICLALLIASISLFCLSFIGSIVLKVRNSLIFHWFTLFGLGIPFYLFIMYLIMYKIKMINDIYLIHLEIKYLSICIIVRIFAFALDMIIYKYDHWLFFLTCEIFTTFLSVWIQCWWVLNKLQLQDTEKDLQLLIGNNNSSKNLNINVLRMIDIFEEKMSFEIFIRHCTHELTIESILFLIELSQFKATLNLYNANGINELNYKFIDVNNHDFIKYIKQTRQEKINTQLIIHPAPKNDKEEEEEEEELPRTDSLIPPTSPSFDSHSLTDLRDSIDTPPPSSPPAPMSNLSVSNIINLRNRNESHIASIRQATEYTIFQNSVLLKKWLPIAKPLLAVNELSNNKSNNSQKHSNEKSTTKSTTTTSNKTKTKTKTKLKTALSQTSSQKLSHNAYIAPISLAVIEDSTFQISENQNNENQNQITVDINWIYEFGRHLYLKYVDNCADLAINISHGVRKNLWTVYSKELNEEAFQTIQLIHHNDLSKIGTLTNKEEQLFIQTYLYHSFDMAFHSVWCLLKSDTFYRFRKTNQYTMLCNELDIKKFKDAKDKREKEYSKSYQETQLDV